jgi:hypothetical protein
MDSPDPVVKTRSRILPDQVSGLLRLHKGSVGEDVREVAEGVTLICHSTIGRFSYELHFEELGLSLTFEPPLYDPQGHVRIRLDEELEDEQSIVVTDEDGLQEPR